VFNSPLLNAVSVVDFQPAMTDKKSHVTLRIVNDDGAQQRIPQALNSIAEHDPFATFFINCGAPLIS